MFWKKKSDTQSPEARMFQATSRVKGSVLFPDILLALLKAEISRQLRKQTLSDGELGDMIAMRIDLEQEMKKYPQEV